VEWVARWKRIELAFDHRQILSDAIRLAQRRR